MRANILALYVAQGLNYLLPLLVLPYMLRVLGAQTYGSIAFAQSLTGYAIIFSDFGFNLSATRAVSIARDDRAELARIFWSTLGAKAILLLISAAIIVPLMALVPAFHGQWQVVAACSLNVLGSVFLPQWYFQGLEQVRTLAVIHVAAKLAALAATFLFVHSSDDVLMAAAILSMPMFVAAVLACLLVRTIAPIPFYRPSALDIRTTLASSWHLFVSNAATSLYINSNVFLLGLISGPYAVGLYSVANKICLAVFNLLSPVIQATFPRASILFSQSPHEARLFARHLARFMLPVSALLSVALCLFAPWMVQLLAGDGYSEAVPVLRVMGVLPVLLTGATLLAQIVMINIGLTRSLSRIYLLVGVLSVALLPLLASRFGALGAAVALVIAETIGPILMIRSVRRAVQRS